MREEVAAAARALARAGLVADAQGNVSARDGDRVYVTATGLALAGARPEDVSVVRLDGSVLEGPEPSSELRVHLAIYAAFADARAVVHGHALPPGDPSVPTAPFAPEGSAELADSVVAAMRDGAPLVVMERHGTVAQGRTLEEALAFTASSVAR